MFQTHLNLTADTLRMQDIAYNFQNFLGGWVIPSKSDLCRAQSGTHWTSDKMVKLLTILLRDINIGKQVCNCYCPFYTPAPPEGVYCFISVRPRYFSSHFSPQLLMAEI